MTARAIEVIVSAYTTSDASFTYAMWCWPVRTKVPPLMCAPIETRRCCLSWLQRGSIYSWFVSCSFSTNFGPTVLIFSSLVDPYKESGQNLYRQYAGKKGKIVLSANWVYECVKAGALQTYVNNWAGCKVTGQEKYVIGQHTSFLFS